MANLTQNALAIGSPGAAVALSGAPTAQKNLIYAGGGVNDQFDVEISTDGGTTFGYYDTVSGSSAWVILPLSATHVRTNNGAGSGAGSVAWIEDNNVISQAQATSALNLPANSGNGNALDLNGVVGGVAFTKTFVYSNPQPNDIVSIQCSNDNVNWMQPNGLSINIPSSGKTKCVITLGFAARYVRANVQYGTGAKGTQVLELAASENQVGGTIYANAAGNVFISSTVSPINIQPAGTAAAATAGQTIELSGQAGGAASGAAAGGVGGAANLLGGTGGAGGAAQAPGVGGAINLTAGNAGAFAGSGNAAGGAVNITTGNGSGATAAGGAFNATMGQGAGASAAAAGGNGGAFVFNGGAGGAGSAAQAAGQGGGFTLATGAAGADGGGGGNSAGGISLSVGLSTGNVNGGTVTITAGPAVGTGNGGACTIAAGTPTGTGNGGALNLNAGAGGPATAGTAAGQGGVASVTGGTGGAGSAAQVAGGGGNVFITAGTAGANGGGGGANGGNVNMDAGAATGAGTAGTIRIGTVNASKIAFGASAHVPAVVSAAGINYIATETGANNAIVAALTDAAGANIAQTDGLVISIKLAHTLQAAGANTLNFNGNGAAGIVSHRDAASNIAAGYGIGGYITLQWAAAAAKWLDLSQ